MIYCYRTLCDIVTNNGKLFMKVLEILRRQYNVPVHHIRISDYKLYIPEFTVLSLAYYFNFDPLYGSPGLIFTRKSG